MNNNIDLNKKYNSNEIVNLTNDELLNIARNQLLTSDFVGKEAKRTILEEMIVRWIWDLEILETNHSKRVE